MKILKVIFHRITPPRIGKLLRDVKATGLTEQSLFQQTEDPAVTRF